MNFQELYDILNEEQKKAVDHIEWPAMVIAWPWTWKTQVLWARTTNLILKAWVNPENILITTFTESWVIAIKERLLKFIGPEAHKVYVSTIHSLASDIIKTFAEKFEFEKTSSLVDDVDGLEFLSDIIEKLHKEKKLEFLVTNYDKLFYLNDIKRAIWNLKQEWISLEKFEILIKEEEKYYDDLLEEKRNNKRIKKIEKYEDEYKKIIWKMQELLLIYKTYDNFLKNNSFYDFSDMINFVLEKFKIDDELKYYYAEKFQYIMLDEYQDTNNAQNQIIDLILSVSPEKDFPNIMVVWDDDQSIYRFQWANIENMLDFSNKYKRTKFIVLEKNYRSSQTILDASSSLIKNNNERLVNKIPSLTKNLVSMKNSSHMIKELKEIWEKQYKNDSNPEQGTKWQNSKPVFYSASNGIDEKIFVLEKIKELNWENNKQKLNDIAIILRTNKEVEEWSLFLQENWIPVESKLKTNILNSKYIDFIIKYLEIIENPYACEESIIDVMRCSFVDINNLDVININRYLYNLNYSRKNKLKIWDFLKKFEQYYEWNEKLELREIDKLLNFRENIASMYSKVSDSSFVIFFNNFIENIKILDYVEKNWTFDDLEDIFTLFQKIKSWTLIKKDFSINNLITKLNLHKKYKITIERQILKTQKDWIQIMTWHWAKWLEYDIVFIPWLQYGNWDNKKVIEKIKLPFWIVWDWIQFSRDEDKDNKKQRDLEEERRLFFVALTRAKNYLYLSFPRTKDKKINIISQFAEELEDNINFIESKIADEKNLNEIIKNSLIWVKDSLFNYWEIELEYIKEFLKNYKLSPSDLNKFLEDPMIFLKEAIFRYPFVDNEATIFWKVYHRSLELFFIKYKKENVIPKLDYLTSTFSLLLKQEILSPEEFERLEERWLKWLSWYYNYYSWNFKQTLELEYNFRWRNIIFAWIPLTWKIDKIEKMQWFIPWENPSSNWQFALFKEAVNIIDYKTWSIKWLSQIKWIDRNWVKKDDFTEWKHWRQLLFYKLLCELDKEFSAKYDIASMWIDFVEWRNNEYKIIQVDFSFEEYDEFKDLLVDTWNKINDLNFWRELLIWKK